jgi:DNA primase
LTPHQIGLVMRFAPKVVINYDGDPAGRTAAFRAVPLFFEKGVETRVLVLPENLDPDEFLRKNGREAYDALYPGAAPGLKYIIDYAALGKRMDVPEVKTKVLRSVLAVLEEIPDALVRSEYLRQTAEHFGVEESLLRRLAQGKPTEKAAGEKDPFFPAEKRLLLILLESKELRPLIFAEMNEEDVQGLKSEPIFAIMFNLFKNDKDFILNEIQKSVGPALSQEISLTLLEKGDPPSLEEALDCLCALQIARKESEVRRIQAEIAREEKSGERSKLAALMGRKQDLTRQIIALK